MRLVCVCACAGNANEKYHHTCPLSPRRLCRRRRGRAGGIRRTEKSRSRSGCCSGAGKGGNASEQAGKQRASEHQFVHFGRALQRLAFLHHFGCPLAAAAAAAAAGATTETSRCLEVAGGGGERQAAAVLERGDSKLDVNESLGSAAK